MNRLVVASAAALSAAVAACGPTTTLAPTAPPAVPSLQATLRITAEPTLPPDTSSPADTPSREEGYQQLAVSIPADIARTCETAPASETLEPGQLAQADCDLSNGSLADFVDYKLFDSPDSMNAFFDIQRKGHENGGQATGPGCGKGPGEGSWENGRKDCFTFVTNDSQVMWTHDLLFIEASAFRDDGDFAKLEQFWQTAGPITP